MILHFYKVCDLTCFIHSSHSIYHSLFSHPHPPTSRPGPTRLWITRHLSSDEMLKNFGWQVCLPYDYLVLLIVSGITVVSLEMKSQLNSLLSGSPARGWHNHGLAYQCVPAVSERSANRPYRPLCSLVFLQTNSLSNLYAFTLFFMIFYFVVTLFSSGLDPKLANT